MSGTEEVGGGSGPEAPYGPRTESNQGPNPCHVPYCDDPAVKPARGPDGGRIHVCTRHAGMFSAFEVPSPCVPAAGAGAEKPRPVTDGGMDPETVKGSVRPGDVVVTVGEDVVRVAELYEDGFLGFRTLANGVREPMKVAYMDVGEYFAREQHPDPLSLAKDYGVVDEDATDEGDQESEDSED